MGENSQKSDILMIRIKDKEIVDKLVNIFNSCIDEKKSLVMEWLLTTIGYPKYYPLFVENGFDSMEFIKGIEDRSILQQIGIKKIGHQTFILQQIQILNNRKK